MLVPVITELPNDSLPAIAFSDPAALCVLRVFVVSFRSPASIASWMVVDPGHIWNCWEVAVTVDKTTSFNMQRTCMTFSPSY